MSDTEERCPWGCPTIHTLDTGEGYCECLNCGEWWYPGESRDAEEEAAREQEERWSWLED